MCNLMGERQYSKSQSHNEEQKREMSNSKIKKK